MKELRLCLGVVGRHHYFQEYQWLRLVTFVGQQAGEEWNIGVKKDVWGEKR